jgi:hypothetical protein
MNTARIVVLTTAVGPAACPASGADSSRPSRLEPAARLAIADLAVARSDIGPIQAVKPEPEQAGTLDRAPLSLNRIADLDIIQSSARDQVSRRGDSINVTTQK